MRHIGIMCALALKLYCACAELCHCTRSVVSLSAEVNFVPFGPIGDTALISLACTASCNATKAWQNLRHDKARPAIGLGRQSTKAIIVPISQENTAPGLVRTRSSMGRLIISSCFRAWSTLRNCITHNGNLKLRKYRNIAKDRARIWNGVFLSCRALPCKNLTLGMQPCLSR